MHILGLAEPVIGDDQLFLTLEHVLAGAHVRQVLTILGQMAFLPPGQGVMPDLGFMLVPVPVQEIQGIVGITVLGGPALGANHLELNANVSCGHCQSLS